MISLVVEGIVDEVVATRMIEHVGAKRGPTYGKRGRPDIHAKIQGYNRAAERTPWFVLVDLDRDDCPAGLRSSWLPTPSEHLCFRVAVRAVESWLLSDQENLARFLAVSAGKLPRDPEAIADPKRALVNVARSSRRLAIRRDMVPKQGDGRSVGPAYASRVMEFAANDWEPERAARVSHSLARALSCLRRLRDTSPGTSR